MLVGDAQLGEDLLQHVLARLAVRWHVVSQADDLDAYVRRALINTAVSWRRRRSWYERPSAHASQEPQVEAVDYDDTLLRALRLLPPRQRAVVVLRHYADQSERQTAALLGCSVGTVKSQHAKGIGRLRAILAVDRETT